MRPEVALLRKNVYDFINQKIFTTKFEPPVLEIGPMQLEWTPIKEYFVNTKKYYTDRDIEYKSIDTDENAGTDIISDVLNLKKHFEPLSVGGIIALEVLEHVSEIWEIPKIFYDILKPNGFIFISTPYYFYRHSPFPDYWRISEDGLKLLFNKLFDIKIYPLIYEDERKPLHYTLIGQKK